MAAADTTTVDDSAKKIEKTATDSGTTSQKLVQEVHTQLQNQQSVGNDAFGKALTQKLVDSNVLPAVILAEVDNPQGIKKFGDGNQIDRKSLQSVVNGTDNQSPEEKLVAQALLDNFNQVSGGKDVITTTQLETWAQGKTKNGPTIQLDDAALSKTAEELHDAIHNSGFLRTADPQKDKIQSLIAPLSEADRVKLERLYHDKYDANGSADSLRKEIKKAYGSDDVGYRQVEAALNAHDGRTNDAGALMVAITTASKDQEKGNVEIRAVIETLNFKQLQQLDQDYFLTYGEHYYQALDRANLTKASRAALPLLEKGTDARTSDDVIKLANIAVDAKDKHLFGEIMREPLPATLAARQLLLNDEQFKEKLAAAFPTDSSFEYTNDALGPTGVKRNSPEPGSLQTVENLKQWVDPIALDYLAQGKIGLDKIADANHGKWIFDNDGNTSLAVKNATDEERAKYATGRQLQIATHDNPPMQGPLTPQQQSALQYYNEVHKSFGSDERQAAIFEDQLLHKHDTLVSSLANSWKSGFGAMGVTVHDSYSKNDLITRAENLTAEDWQLLKTDPNYRKEIEAALNTFASKEDRDRVLALLDQKTADNVKDYKESVNIHRSLDEYINDNKESGWWRGGTSYDGKNVVQGIELMTAAEASRYKDADPEFRNRIDDLVAHQLSGDEQFLAQRLLAQVASTGAPPKLDALSTFFDDKIKGGNNEKLISDAEAAFKEDPGLKARLSGPLEQLNSQDQHVYEAFANLINNEVLSRSTGRVNPDGTPNKWADDPQHYLREFLAEGRLSLQSKVELGYPKSELLPAIAMAPIAEREAMKPFLKPEELKLIDAIAQHGGKPDLSDQIRMFVIGDGGNYEDLKSSLQKLPHDELQRMKQEYFNNFQSDLDKDFLSRVKESDRPFYTQLLTPSDSDGRNVFYQLANKAAADKGWAADGTGLTLQNSVDQYAKELTQYQAIYQTLSPDKQAALDQYFSQAFDQHVESKQKLAEIVSDALITAAALTAAPFTGGATVATIAFVAGGLTRTAVSSAIEGSDFKWTPENIAREMITGGTSAVLNFLGPEVFGLGPLLEKTGGRITEDVLQNSGKNLLRGGDEKLFREQLQGFIASTAGKPSDAQLAEFVNSVAAAGITDQERAALRNTISYGLNTYGADISKGLLDQQKNAGLAFAQRVGTSSLIGGSGNAVSDIVAAPFNPNGLDVKQLLTSSLTGVAFGATIHVGMESLQGGKKFVMAVSKEVGPNGDTVLIAHPGAGRAYEVQTTDAITGELKTVRLEDGQPLPDVVRSVVTESPGVPDKDGVWTPQRGFEGLNEAQIQRLKLDLAEHYVIGSDAAQKQFAELFGNSVKGWSGNQAELMDLVSKEVAARSGRADSVRTYDSMRDNLVAQLKGKIPDSELKTIVENQTNLKTFLEEQKGNNKYQIENVDDKLATIEKLRSSNADAAAVQMHIDSLLQTRTGLLQDSLDQFTTSHGLPNYKIQVVENLGEANAVFSDGTIKILRSELISGDRAQLLGAIYHELTHGEQQFDILRSLSDTIEKRGDGPVTPAKLREEFKTQMYSPDALTDEYLNQVLQRRNGQPLTAEQTAYTESLKQTWREMHPINQEFSETANQVRTLNGKLDRLSTSDPESLSFANNYLDALRNTGTSPYEQWDQLVGRGLGAENMPAELQAKFYKLMVDRKDFLDGKTLVWNAEDARKTLQEIFLKRQEGLNNYRKGLWDSYTGPSQTIEWDARANGNIVESQAQAIGLAGDASGNPATNPYARIKGTDYLAQLPPGAPQNVGVPGGQRFTVSIDASGTAINFNLDKQTIALGRDSGNDLLFNDGSVSRKHASLTKNADGTYSINDLASSNGTFIQRNGEMIRVNKPETLQPSDVVFLGSTAHFKFDGAVVRGQSPHGDPYEAARDIISYGKPQWTLDSANGVWKDAASGRTYLQTQEGDLFFDPANNRGIWRDTNGKIWENSDPIGSRWSDINGKPSPSGIWHSADGSTYHRERAGQFWDNADGSKFWKDNTGKQWKFDNESNYWTAADGSSFALGPHAPISSGLDVRVGETVWYQGQSTKIAGFETDGSVRISGNFADKQMTVSATDLGRANPSIVTDEALRLAPDAASAQRVLATRAQQELLRTAPIQVDYKLSSNEGAGFSTVYRATITLPDGTTQRVFLNPVGDVNSFSVSTTRLHNDMIGQELSANLFGDFPVGTERVVNIGGKPTVVQIQASAGEDFWIAATDMAEKKFGKVDDATVAALIEADPNLRRQWEQIMVERAIFGDGDTHPANFALDTSGSEPRIRNIDLDHAFGTNTMPDWVANLNNRAFQKDLMNDLTGKPLSPDTVKAVQKFYELYNSPAGRQRLGNLGLDAQQIEAMLDRTRWFLQNQTFPPIATDRTRIF